MQKIFLGHTNKRANACPLRAFINVHQFADVADFKSITECISWWWWWRRRWDRRGAREVIVIQNRIKTWLNKFIVLRPGFQNSSLEA
jgi:hypothetical protein